MTHNEHHATKREQQIVHALAAAPQGDHARGAYLETVAADIRDEVGWTLAWEAAWARQFSTLLPTAESLAVVEALRRGAHAHGPAQQRGFERFFLRFRERLQRN